MIIKLFIKFLLILSLSLSPIYSNIDKEIDRIQHASNKERFKLMNALKKKIVRMKEKERVKAIKKLSILSNNKRDKDIIKEIRSRKRRKRDRDRSAQHDIENEAQDHIEDSRDEK